MKLTLAIGSLLALSTSTLAAETFSSELSFSRFDSKTRIIYDGFSNSSFSSNNLGYRLYLTESNAGAQLPYAASKQFGRRSSVAMNYMRSESKVSLGNINESIDFNAWQLGGIYQATEHDWYFSLDYLNLNAFPSHKIKSSLGYYFQPNWLVKLDVQQEKAGHLGNYWHYGISTEKIWAFESGSFLSLSAAYLNHEKIRGDGFALALDYYFNKAFSVGAFISDDIPENYIIYTNRAGLRSSWFVTPQLKLHASIGLEDVSDSEYAWDFGISWRF
ncbi:hypothetical protein GCM10010919_01530 [Alishewanella longhuensis]|uniref:Porin n=1 Tax=Alishewanella longhuensis TaxID=1091037 RepID=A0ABQ3KSX2_9ALTE|nr:putative porin [Alishewanella longhuensis]GHG59196.1 hypothetical protein GCM10010919_01530 [Alishewanella longhuensis]